MHSFSRFGAEKRASFISQLPKINKEEYHMNTSNSDAKNRDQDSNLIALAWKLVDDCLNVAGKDTIPKVREIIHHSNELSAAASEVIRTLKPTEFDGDVDIVTHDPIYRIVSTFDGLYLRVPLAPYSIQRNAQRTADPDAQSYGRRRYTEVEALLRCAKPVTLYGRKVLYILHVYSTKSRYRASPDFDNYDIKDLIDVVTAHFGGDNTSNIVVIHDAFYSEKLMSATYLSIHELDRSCQLADLLEEIENIFWQM